LDVDFKAKTGFFEDVGIAGGEIVAYFPSLAANADGLVNPHKPFVVKHILSLWGIEEVGTGAFGKFQNFQKWDFIYYASIEFVQVV
jgi:hypothetical protein